MNELLAQIILAARRDTDDTGWMNILVLVIVAVIYGLGSILKAKSKKVKEEGEEQLPGKPARRPPESAKGLEKQFIQQARRPAGPAPAGQNRPQVRQPRRKVMRPQPAVQRVAAKIKETIRLATLEVPEVSKVSPLLGPLEEPEELLGEPLKGLEDKRPGILSEEVPTEEFFEEPLLDYAEPDELTRAILHYEILGRPLSLRGPGEKIIGL